ncbi:MAG: Uncharacterized protein G01um101429_394 [Parcubacteria group bacterium Gr01-1014_29]|nr:MAG: Uncharacterized protein G01um101429_394 [Parcubacteria group bacterium Gr01-1014_29]
MVSKSSKKPIKFRQSLFWDVDPKTIDPKKNAKYIIERILEFGMIEELTWMFHYYPLSLIRDRVYHSRGVIRKKSKALWSLVLR